MTHEQIIDLLKQIKYPGFSRDIVSFGMVKEVSIREDNVDIKLNVSTEKTEVLRQIEAQIKKTIGTGSSAAQVTVSVEHQSPPQKSNAQATSGGSDNMMQPSEVPGVKHIIAVASGKGGVGKSTVAVNLASILSKKYKVGILDLDIYGPSLPMVLGVSEVPKITPEQKIIPVKKNGMQIMSFGLISGNQAPTIWRGPLVARMTQQFFDDVMWDGLDYLILDLPPGTGDVQLTLVQKFKLAGAIIVTTPQALAVLDVRKGADMFRKVNTPVLGIVENMTHFLCPHCEKATEIFPGHGGESEAHRLDVPLLGQIYMTPEIAMSGDAGTPYVTKYPDSPITGIYTQIMEKIVSAVPV